LTLNPHKDTVKPTPTALMYSCTHARRSPVIETDVVEGPDVTHAGVEVDGGRRPGELTNVGNDDISFREGTRHPFGGACVGAVGSGYWSSKGVL